MTVHRRFGFLLVLSVFLPGCKLSSTTPPAAAVKDAAPAGDATTTPANASADCQIDPQAIANQMYNSPTYYSSGPAKTFVEHSAADIKRMCVTEGGGKPAGFSDPACGQFCDACTAGLGSDAQLVYTVLSTADGAAKAFGKYGGALKPLSGLAGNVATVYAKWGTALRLNGALAASGCASALYDLGKTIYYFEGPGSTPTERLAKMLCDANWATNSCVVVPGVGEALLAYNAAMLANPAGALLKVGVTIECAVAPFVANTLIKCPAFKAACLGAVANAQPIDNGTCCACGNLLDGSSTVLVQTWGGSAYGSPATCENLDDAGVRRKFSNMPVGGRAACLRVPIDRTKTRGCTLQRVVYGANISCNKDRDVYCVDQPIVTASGQELHAPSTPLLGECTKYISQEDLGQLIASYAKPLQKATITIDQGATAAADPVAGGTTVGTTTGDNSTPATTPQPTDQSGGTSGGTSGGAAAEASGGG